MGTTLSLVIAPEHLSALLGLPQEEIDRAFGLVEAYEKGYLLDEANDNGYTAYCAMMDDPVASILSAYQRPFKYEGEILGGSLSFGKWGFRRGWDMIKWKGIPNVDPICGSLDRKAYPPEVDRILASLRMEDTRNLNWIVLEEHCTGVQWA